MQQIFSKCVAAALAIGVVIAASSAAQAHHHHARKWRAGWPGTLPYSYSYFPIIGYSYYGRRLRRT